MILTLYNPFKICIRMNKHESYVKKEKKRFDININYCTSL